MGKNKEQFMKDKEKEMTRQELYDTGTYLLSHVIKMKNEYKFELEETKHLLSKCKTLITDMVLLENRPESYNDIMEEAHELLTELKEN